MSRQAGERIRGTLEFMPLLLTLAKEEDRITVENKVRRFSISTGVC
jgi:hypothetical protein